jgi:hypothetical protein
MLVRWLCRRSVAVGVMACLFLALPAGSLAAVLAGTNIGNAAALTGSANGSLKTAFGQGWFVIYPQTTSEAVTITVSNTSPSRSLCSSPGNPGVPGVIPINATVDRSDGQGIGSATLNRGASHPFVESGSDRYFVVVNLPGCNPSAPPLTPTYTVKVKAAGGFGPDLRGTRQPAPVQPSMASAGPPLQGHIDYYQNSVPGPGNYQWVVFEVGAQERTIRVENTTVYAQSECPGLDEEVNLLDATGSPIAPPTDLIDNHAFTFTVSNPGQYYVEVYDLCASGTSGPKAWDIQVDPGNPTPPSSVTVKAVSDHQVSLAWNAPSSWGGANPSSYIIKLSQPNLNGQATITVPATTATPATATLNYLHDGVPVTFQVAAQNSAGLVSTYSAASTSATPSPTVAVTNRLTLSAAPSASGACPALPGRVTATACFDFQQNFFVSQVNPSPSATPIIWAQNVILAFKRLGHWWLWPFTNVWNYSTRKPLYAFATPSAYAVSSYPVTVNVSTAVTTNKITFSDSRAGSAPFSTWPGSASPAPFSVVDNPEVGIALYDPQAVLVGSANLYTASFSRGTVGTINSSASLQNGAKQTGTACPVTRTYVSTGETSQGLAWTVSNPQAGFKFTTATGTPEGVAFLPQVLGCSSTPPPYGVQRPEIPISELTSIAGR